jgi:hypothetical protein
MQPHSLGHEMSNQKPQPTVFLSYSRNDEDFIEKVHQTLTRCRITPWRDVIDIGHGEPWLDAIFESGIPTCDCVMVYLTASSIESPMVKKEIDAAVLRKLKDKQIGFLPYVQASDLRTRLRIDLQSLNIIEWNDSNFLDVLPRVVAEIWQSFAERTVTHAVNSERVKRLEAELQLERISKETQAQIFSGAEETDFEYIVSALNREHCITLITQRNNPLQVETPERTYKFRVNLLPAIMVLLKGESVTYEDHAIERVLIDRVCALHKLPRKAHWKPAITSAPSLKLAPQLLTYGLIERIIWQEIIPRPFATNVTRGRTQFTSKAYRFKYWLETKNRFTDEITLVPEQDSATPNAEDSDPLPENVNS